MNKNQVIKNLLKIILILSLLILSMFGGLLNGIAVTENGGKMPVKFEKEWSSSTHFTYQFNKDVNYWYLTDIFVFKNVIYSIGDIFIYLFGFGSIVCSIHLVYVSIKLYKKEYDKKMSVL